MKKILSSIVIALALIVGAQYAGARIYNPTNATTISSPITGNLIGGIQQTVTVGGTANAITLTPTTAITSYASSIGMQFAFVASGTNTVASPTIAISGLAALNTTMGSVALPIGGILSGNIYTAYIESATSIRVAPFDSLSSNGDTVNGSLDMAAGSAYKYNGANIAMASTTLYNYFLGGAGNLTMTGTYNTGTGYQALLSNTTGSNNTANGMQSLYSNTTGVSNTANGTYSLYSNTTGANNTASGLYSLRSNTTGNFNTANGQISLFSNTTGVGLVALGYYAGYGDGTTVDQRSVIDNYGTFLGYQASRDASVASTTVLTNITAIGKNARVGASNTIVLGGTGADAVNVGINTIAPTAKFDVHGAGTGTGITLQTAGSDGVAKFSILDNGSTGVGTTTPNSLFHVTAGTNATTTIEWGDQYSATSKTCYNTKNTAGTAISFYFVGTTLTTENNRCR